VPNCPPGSGPSKSSAMGSVFSSEAPPEPAPPLAQAEGRIVSAANRAVPPARVRDVFIMMDTDKDGALSLEELKVGFAKDLKIQGDLPKQVLACLETNFAAWAPDGLLKKEIFCRLYAEVLFAYFDEDKNGTLELAEAQKALTHLVKKPYWGGEKATPTIAFPPEFMGKDGEVHVPFESFFMYLTAMD